MSESQVFIPRQAGHLSDLVDLVRDKYAPTAADTDVPCINLEDVPQGSGRAVSWSKASENLSIKTKFEAGDILFGKLRPYLRKYAQPSFAGLCTSELLAFRAKPGVDPRYAYQVVGSPEFIDHCVAASFGTKMPRTDWRTASAFPVDIPGELEQRRIADLLSAVDEQIENVQLQIEKLALLREGLFDELFGAGLPTPDADIATAPLRQGWQRVGVLQAVRAILDFRGRTPLKLGMSWGGGTIPALSANNVEMGRVNFQTECYLGSDSLYRKWMTQGDCAMGDVLMTLEAPLGNVALVPDQAKYILSQRVVLLKPNEELVSGPYLYLFLRWRRFQQLLVRNSTGTTATGIQRKRLEQLPVLLAPDALMPRLVDTLMEHLELESGLAIEARKLQSVKAGLLGALLAPKAGAHDDPLP